MADPSRSAAVEAEPIEQLQQKVVARIYTFGGVAGWGELCLEKPIKGQRSVCGRAAVCWRGSLNDELGGEIS